MAIDPLVARRRVANVLFYAMTWTSGIVGILVPIVIAVYLLSHGGKVLDLGFWLDRPRGSPLGSAGGILPAISGSLCLVLLGLAVALPCARVIAAGAVRPGGPLI